MIDDRTALLNLPLPNIQNALSEDVLRISSSLTAIDAAMSDLSTYVPVLNQNTTGNAATATALSAGEDRTKLDSIEVGALAYVHPNSHPPGIITQDLNNRFVTDAEKTTWNSKQNAGSYVIGSGTSSGINTGDETLATIRSKLGIANLSGSNTGDQTNITGNAATVTTNANLTGHIKSIGNATELGSFTLAQLNTAISDADIQTNQPVEIVTATSVNAVAGKHYVLTNVSATTVTLPASPASGDTVWISVKNDSATNSIERNGQTIMGLAEDMLIDSLHATVQLRYVNNDWRIL